MDKKSESNGGGGIDNSNFHKFFGDYPIVRVLDFLLENEGFDYSKTDISREADVSIGSLYKVWDELEAIGVVAPTRKFGNTTLYKLNAENPLVKKLVEFDFQLSKAGADRLMDKAVMPVAMPA